MRLKKLVALALSVIMVFGLVACGGGTTTTTDPSTEPSAAPSAEPAPGAVEIELWTYPIGDWGKQAQVEALTSAFEAETGIKVHVEYLAYADGDDKVNSAIAAGQAPDLVMEGPERLVANWGVNGHMVDLSDMLDDTDKAEIQASVLNACTAADGSVYEYPLVMTAHCMAVNVDAFKAAGADQYLDLETHTWTTEDFINAVAALYAHYGQTVGAVYCVGQGGDQGTRALVNNLYGGTFTNAEHTAYTWDDPLNIQALQQLKDMDGIAYDASIAGGDEIALFYQGVLKMAFCWNIAQQLNPNQADTGAGLTMNGEEIAFMSFPSETGESQLQGGIWGFGVFDNGDDAKAEASKRFIAFICDDPEWGPKSVVQTGAFPVRASFGNLYEGNEEMSLLASWSQYYGPYYNTRAGFAAMRPLWFNMLQQVFNGTPAQEAADAFNTGANA